MRPTRRDFSLGFAAAAAAPAAARAGASDRDRALTAFLDVEFDAWLRMNPEELTRLGRKTSYNRLTDRSDQAADRMLAWRRDSVARMRARFDRTALGDDARVSYDLWVLELERAESSRKWRGHEYVFARGGPHTAIPNFLINAHRVDFVYDMDAYIARLRAVGPAIDAELSRAQRAAAAGVRMPRFAYDQALDEIGRLMRGAPFGGEGTSPLLADVAVKLSNLLRNGETEPNEGGALRARAVRALTQDVKPAYDRLAAWLAADHANADADPRGAGALPDGAAYYAAMLRDQTTTAMSADEIHALGLSEVARIRREMEALKTRIGFEGTLADFFVFMRTERQFYLSNDDLGRARYLKLAGSYLTTMKARLPEVFARLPRANLIVKRVESFREEPGGAAHYSSGAVDGSRPGVFYVHLSDTAATPTYELEGTAYHEGWPGHHLQVSLAQEMTGIPEFRTQAGYGAYVEGWGLYSELLAKDIGFYTDPYNDFGRLGREIWRAIRLVVDTGLHAKGWSEAQALEYYTANSPQPPAKIRSEIRRYLVTPGQATSYKVGMVKIVALREEARAALGPRFDLRGFHDAVLSAGALPLDVLEMRVRSWVKAQQA